MVLLALLFREKIQSDYICELPTIFLKTEN